jgi:hypothetical protein
MAFSFVKFQHEIWSGNQRMVTGTFSNSEGSTGGVIYTGLHHVQHMTLQHTGNQVIASAPAVKTLLPSPDPIEIVTAPNSSGIFIAVGE